MGQTMIIRQHILTIILIMIVATTFEQNISSPLSANLTMDDNNHNFNDMNNNNTNLFEFDDYNFDDNNDTMIVNKTSTSPLSKMFTSDKSDSLIPWIVFIAFIFIPMILIAVILLLLLFITLFEDRNRYNNNSKRKSKKSSKESKIVNLEFPTKLLPTLPDQHYFPLQYEIAAPIIYGEQRLQYYYFLDINTTVKFLRTNQLYHPYSGLLFHLKPNLLYDPLKHCNVRFDSSNKQNNNNNTNGQMEASTSNQVYSTFTNEIYERYQFMYYNLNDDCFMLTDYKIIPRLPIELTPEDYVQTYQQLLNKSSKNSNNNQLKNPLLLDRRDFTKPQASDFHQTPRSLLPIDGGKITNANNPAKDDQSQYASIS